MADKKSNASKRMRGLPEPIELEFRSLLRRINVVEYTAVCIEMALLERRTVRDREIAICLEANVANELERISKDAAVLMTALGLPAPTPEVDSLVLGMRIRPILDDPARKSRGARGTSHE